MVTFQTKPAPFQHTNLSPPPHPHMLGLTKDTHECTAVVFRPSL